MDDELKLEPCPLCGHKAKSGNAYLENGCLAAEVQCQNIMCELQLIVFYEDEPVVKNKPGDRVVNSFEEAIKEARRRWNRRANAKKSTLDKDWRRHAS